MPLISIPLSCFSNFIYLSFHCHCPLFFVSLISCLPISPPSLFSSLLTFPSFVYVFCIPQCWLFLPPLPPLSIELQVQEQPPEARSDIYSHMEAFVPCNKEALLKRLKKLSLNIQVSEAYQWRKWEIPSHYIDLECESKKNLSCHSLSDCSVVTQSQIQERLKPLYMRTNLNCESCLSQKHSETILSCSHNNNWTSGFRILPRTNWYDLLFHHIWGQKCL